MATAAADTEAPVRRRNSNPYLPPHMSELRAVLLGNSCSLKSSVGNMILGENCLNVNIEPDCCQRVSTVTDNKVIILINTPHLQHENLSVEKQAEFAEALRRLCDPEPNLFLLVLQPEIFTEKQKETLQFILQMFDSPYNHMLTLISTSKEKSSDVKETYLQDLLLGDFLSECKYEFIQNDELQPSTLWTTVYQFLEEKDREQLGLYKSTDVHLESPSSHGNQRQEKEGRNKRGFLKDKGKRLVNFTKGWIPSFLSVAGQSEAPQCVDVSVHGCVTVALRQTGDQSRASPEPMSGQFLGRCEDTRSKLSNFIIGEEAFHSQTLNKVCVTTSREWSGKSILVVKTPDLFEMSNLMVRKEISRCRSLCFPGPNVLLLMVKPSDFTQEDAEKLNFILSLFGQNSFKHSIIVLTHNDKHTDVLNQLLQRCGGRQYNMWEKNHGDMMKNIEKMMSNNKGSFLNFTEETRGPQCEQIKPDLNLVLCGRRGAGKTSAAKNILGPSVSLQESVRNQAEVCGRWVSVVELPALFEKPQKEVMQESFRCVSLYDLKGIHAFILVLPVNSLTAEDKGELLRIEKTFGSQVKDFTRILFTVDSDPKDPNVVNFVEKDEDIQKLCQSCGGRYNILNIRNKQQISELLENIQVEKSYSAEAFVQAQMETIVELEEKVGQPKPPSDEEQKSPESLRIVLIGRTGSGKSSSGNTILGRKEFKSDSSPTSITRLCQKAQGEVDSRPVFVVDTPGLFDTAVCHKEVREEMVKCISLLAPGPHVFLLVIQIGRFTPEEKETLKLIKESFGEQSEQFTFILFTRGDDLAHNEKTIKEYIEEDTNSLKKLIKDCDERYHVFNNRDKNNQQQVSELITKLNTMVKKNRGCCFSNEMLEEAEAAIQKEIEKILKEKEEEIQKEKQELTRKHEEEMQELKRKMEEEKIKLQQESELKLKEIDEKIKKEHEQQEKEKKKEREKKNNETQKDEERQREALKKQIEELDKKIQSAEEEKRTELEKERKEKQTNQEALEKERTAWWEKVKQEEERRGQEEQKRLNVLKEQLEKEKEKYEQKNKEEIQIRKELEEKEKKYKEQTENLQKKFEEEARKRAEEKNEFLTKYGAQEETYKSQLKDKDEKYNLFKALKETTERQKREKYQEEIRKLVRCVSKKKENLPKIMNLLKEQEEKMEMTSTQGKGNLQEKHEEEIGDMIQKLLTEVDEKTSCCIL